MSEDGVNIVIRKGAHGTFHTFDNDLITTQIEQFGAHTRNEIAMLLSFVEEGNVCIDLGAHIGTFSVPIAKKIGPSGRLFSVEANPATFDLLLRNLDENAVSGWTKPLCAMVAGEAPIHGERKNVDGNTGAGFYIPSENQGVQSRSCLDLLSEYDFETPDIIKIDVEGMEADTLASISGLLENARPILYAEISEIQLNRWGRRSKDIQEILDPLGYLYFRNVGKRNSLTDEFDICKIESLSDAVKLFDVLAIHKSHPLLPSV